MIEFLIFMGLVCIGCFLLKKIKNKIKVDFDNKLSLEIKKVQESFEEQFNKQKNNLEFRANIEARKLAKDELFKWKTENEKEIRKDAIIRSKSVNLGKISEQLVPFASNFNYNPKDARFLGSPTDLIIFDGLDDGDLKKVVFIEVKTGKSKLNKREELVKEAIQNKRVEWLTLELSDGEE